MKKIKLNAVAEAVAEANGGTISTELLGVLKKAHAAGLNAEYKCAFEKIPAEPRRITYGCPLSEEAEAVLLIRGRMGDREAKQVFFAAYEGLVKKRARPFTIMGTAGGSWVILMRPSRWPAKRSTRQWMKRTW